MKKGKLTVMWLMVLVLILALAACGGEKLEWPKAGLGAMLPQPGTEQGRVGIDSKDSFQADLEPASLADYSDYVAKCKEAGFSVDSEETSEDYTAYNSEGYRLHLYYSEYSKGYSISLDTPKVNGTFQWPTAGLALLLPRPSTDVGTISVDSSSQFNAYIGETSKEEYQAYVSQCMDMGFTVDYDKGDTYFSAENENGDSLFIEYQGFETMAISMYASDLLEESSAPDTGEESSSSAAEALESAVSSVEKEELPESSQAEPTESKEPEKDMTGIRESFKEAMDSYEEFFDEYIAFMEKYKNSEDTAAMLSDYTDFMKRYAEAMEKLNEIDESELSTEEAFYYSEVLLRISQKLASVAE